ncbi:APC family permease [Paractinoplanes bogorensis]|uniref:APC family permease n=1 Tax=Paractinoplanes bogorensis TaxID=1610840 RepID=UPI0027DF5B4E|nr:APC family permease [Actinoplanes bogorensis]
MGTTLAPGRLGAAAVTFFALAATAPIAVLINVVPAAYATGGGPLVPLSFLAVGVVLIFFSAGYAAMANRAPFAGAMYTYVARGLGRPAGVGAAWLALACYQAIQLGLYGMAGVAAAPLLASWFGVTASWWMVAAGCWLLVTLAGTIRAEVVSGLIALLVLAEVAVAVGFTAANVIDPAPGGLTRATIVPTGDVDMTTLGLLLVVGLLAFAGFETTGAYAEESIRPRRDPGLSTYGVVAALAVLIGVASWSLNAATGADRITEVARARGSELLFDLAAGRLAPWAVTIGRLMLLTGLFAAVLALHHAMARYLYALGRERVLPAALGRTSPRTLAPRTAALTQSAVVAVLLAAAAWAGVGDPPTVGRRLMIAGALGLLLVLLATSVAALLHLNRVPNGEGVYTRFVAPVLSIVALGSLGYLAFRDPGALVGVRESLWILPLTLAAVIALGVLHALILRGTRPVIYAGIGQGGAPVVVTPKAPLDEHGTGRAIPRPRAAEAPQEPQEPREPGAHRPERVNR